MYGMIVRLERRVAEPEGPAKPDGPTQNARPQVHSDRQPPAQQQPRKQRRHSFARQRITPTHRVEHVVESYPDCGTHLTGGWVQRTREVIELPVAPVQVTEHVYIARTCPDLPGLARTCPACRRRCLPPAQLDGMALGRQRLGVNLISRIATLYPVQPVAVASAMVGNCNNFNTAFGFPEIYGIREPSAHPGSPNIRLVDHRIHTGRGAHSLKGGSKL